MRVIVTNNPNSFSSLNESVHFLRPYDFNKIPPSKIWENYSIEFAPFTICEAIPLGTSVVAIDFSINASDKYLIANHVITSINPVILFFADNDNFPVHLESDYGLFRNKAIKLISKQKLKEIFADEHELIRYCSIYEDDFDYGAYVETYQRFLALDKHQATNEWGAVKLLLNHGLSLKAIEASYQLPKTIFFKQKLKEFKLESTTIIDTSTFHKKDKLSEQKSEFHSNSAKISRILLIDDNSSRCWCFALQQLFNAATIDILSNYEEACSVTEYSVYDLVFLDLRLPTNTTDTTPLIDNGFKLIERIKGDEKSLHIPLIIFTASQKASTLDEVLEKGADAMYVKESPFLSSSASLDNYLDFISEINFQIIKGDHLKVYWTAIQKIKKTLLPEVIDSGSSKLKSRIIERLEMFYGLIKKKYEQSSYNVIKFHYSSDVLPFITLWSILNEIQECYYEKVKSSINIFYNSSSRTYNPLTKRDRSVFEYISKWHIKNQPSDVYLEKLNISLKIKDSGGFKTDTNGNYIIDSDTTCYLAYNRNRAPYYTTRNSSGAYSKANTYQPEQKLSFQIAFLLLEKRQLKASSKIQDFLYKLRKANEERNRLYITHGEDTNSNFHDFLEKDKILSPSSTLDLFKLVAFLLTNNDAII